MADVSSLQKRLLELRNQGKELSTSKEFAKVYNQIKAAGGKTDSKSLKAAAGISSGGSSNVIQNAISMAQQAVQPAVDTVNKIVPTIKDRYDQLINDLKGQQQTAVNRQTVTTQNELGRRGIIGGGLAEQELTNALQPVNAEYSGMMTQAGNTTQDYLNNLAMQVAGMQSNAGLTGLSTGAGLQTSANSLAQQQSQFNAQQKASADAAKAAADWQKLLYQTIELPKLQKTLNNQPGGDDGWGKS